MKTWEEVKKELFYQEIEPIAERSRIMTPEEYLVKRIFDLEFEVEQRDRRIVQLEERESDVDYNRALEILNVKYYHALNMFTKKPVLWALKETLTELSNEDKQTENN